MLIQEDYFKNIFNTVREAILILDENMRVLSANRSFFTIFKVDSASTIGSLLYDLGNGQWNIPNLRVLLEDILPKNDTVDNFEIEHNFESIGQKTMLLNACKIAGKKNDPSIILLAIEDITERKRLGDLLIRSEELHRRLFETANDGIVLLEKREGNIIHANPAAEKMLGYSVEECIGKNLQDIGVSLDMSDFPTIVQALNKSGIINYDDVQVKTKSGQNIFTDIYIVDRAGLAQCNIRNITERKQKEEEELQKLNRTLLARSNSSRVMMSARDEQWYLDEVCRIIVEDCGHALVWIGFAENDDGSTVKPVAYSGFEDGYLDSIHITWSDRDSARGPVGTAIRTGKPSVFRNILSDPVFAPWSEEAVKRGYAAIISVPLLAEGKAFGSLNIYSRHEDPFSDEEVRLLNDLAADLSYGIAAIRLHAAQAEAESALRKSENNYRILLENLPQKIFHKDKNSVYISCNGNYAGDLRIKPIEIEGKTDYDFFPKELAEKYIADDKRLMELGKTEDIDEKYIQDGQDVWVHTIKAPVRDDSGNVTGVLGLFWDISEHRKLEEQLRQAQKMEAVGTLSGGIAHDFNNILNVIIGYGTMVQDSLQGGSPSREQMNEVLAAAERAANLTKRLLVFSRKQVVEVKPININELILGLQKMLVRIIRESIDFDVDLADRSLVVMADAGQIEQVLMNLVSNAKDAMPNGGRLTIGTGLEEIGYEYIAVNGYGKPGMYALITVSDTGHGMDAETQKKIFEPFFTTKSLGEGTGLGLAISYGIIKQHNGYIKVYSEPGQGTVFKIYLPLIEESAFLEKKTETAFPVKGGNETVLVAEDDASLRDLSRIVLESYGYSVITAEDGEDAISKFMENRERIHLVVLDMIMPKKNGKEVSEVLRKASPGIKILFVSGYTMDIIKDEDLTEFGFDFIHKPTRPQDLLRRVREILDK